MDLHFEHKDFKGVLFSAQHFKYHILFTEIRKQTVVEEIHFQKTESKLKGSSED